MDATNAGKIAQKVSCILTAFPPGHDTMTQVVIADVADVSGPDLSVERSILGPEVDLVYRNDAMGDAELAAVCRDADVVVTDLAALNGNVIGQLRRCKLISVAGTGYSNVDLQAAEAAGVSVCAITEYCTDEATDHVMLLMLALCRKLAHYQKQVQEKKSWHFDSSLNCNMSSENKNLIDAAAFARMERLPIFINCARGELVDEAALIDALDTGQVSAAGLDVLSGEPPDLASSPLVGRDNVILTPQLRSIRRPH
jgi:phosphoglycerate dehydrogenase-like enzyme